MSQSQFKSAYQALANQSNVKTASAEQIIELLGSRYKLSGHPVEAALVLQCCNQLGIKPSYVELLKFIKVGADLKKPDPAPPGVNRFYPKGSQPW